MTTIDIVAMPVAEKLKLMETLWDSLCMQSAVGVTSPAWHGEVLEDRLRRLASGEETVAPWQEAKQRIRAQLKPH
ncbi:MAG: addiction module protein [Rhodocyclaceae bacterium]